ncbi:CbtB domain-containing protein [Catenuloplanes japonicus]|uniref:CbtB domain-containing protein n=1 Tax=Catenuloplanes japonicus TaxID=33876 RepID=UPI0005270641|nr:CbtB-domain containing protein [Catenuloplanes japonicus]
MPSPAPATAVAPIRVPLLAWLLAAVALIVFYLLLQENGLVVPGQVAEYLHEFTHDGRHALGVPCH